MAWIRISLRRRRRKVNRYHGKEHTTIAKKEESVLVKEDYWQ